MNISHDICISRVLKNDLRSVFSRLQVQKGGNSTSFFRFGNKSGYLAGERKKGGLWQASQGKQ